MKIAAQTNEISKTIAVNIVRSVSFHSQVVWEHCLQWHLAIDNPNKIYSPKITNDPSFVYVIDRQDRRVTGEM